MLNDLYIKSSQTYTRIHILVELGMHSLIIFHMCTNYPLLLSSSSRPLIMPSQISFLSLNFFRSSSLIVPPDHRYMYLPPVICHSSLPMIIIIIVSPPPPPPPIVVVLISSRRITWFLPPQHDYNDHLNNFCAPILISNHSSRVCIITCSPSPTHTIICHIYVHGIHCHMFSLSHAVVVMYMSMNVCMFVHIRT